MNTKTLLYIGLALAALQVYYAKKQTAAIKPAEDPLNLIGTGRGL